MERSLNLEQLNKLYMLKTRSSKGADWHAPWAEARWRGKATNLATREVTRMCSGGDI